MHAALTCFAAPHLGRRPCLASPGVLGVWGAGPRPGRRHARGMCRAAADEQQRAREELDLPFESDLATGPKLDTSVPLLRPGERGRPLGGGARQLLHCSTLPGGGLAAAV